jgi:branched-chain amino acid aminotransferase
MINFNGNSTSSDTNLLVNNRAFLYGDGVFETLKIIDNKILFLEDHYFRLMASMRVVRMEIPMNFTMEYFEEQILSLANTNGCSASARARITVYRNEGGYYLPKQRSVSFLINCTALENTVYSNDIKPYEVDLYKDFYVTKQLLSSIKTTNKMINVTGSIFADENGLDNCLMLNDDKNVIEALQGNLFISPFNLQKADELFITNVIKGIQSITKYRKKEFGNTVADELVKRLNAQIRLT